MNILVFDAEIKKAIPNKNEQPIPGIEYCEGWHDHANMGISVMGAYDYNEKRYRVFCDDNKDDFLELMEKADKTVGFNSARFDNCLIKATWGYSVNPEKHYDIYKEVLLARFGSSDVRMKGYGLDDLCRANFGSRKSGNGALAPVDWQQGKIGKVIDYCLNDIRLTCALIEKIRERCELIDPSSGLPFEIEFI